MEHRLSCVLTSTTRGMSKPYYTWEAMRGEINAFQNEQYDEAYEEGVKDTRAECAAEIAALKSEIDDLEMEIRVMGECE